MRLVQGLILLLLTMTGVQASPPTAIPEPLRPWVDWVLHGQEEMRCPLLYSDTVGRRCAWPSALRVAINDQGGRFEQTWHGDAATWLPLPGDRRHWPQSVMLDGTAATVLERDGRPALKAEPGEHRISGQLVRSAVPESFRVPPETALLTLLVDGVAIANPRIEADGAVWLRERAPPATDIQDHLEAQVFRRITDGVPLILTTRLSLRVAGQARELQLGPMLPEGFIPLSLTTPLPARLETDGRLRLQVKPGDWIVEVGARHADPVEALQRPAAGEPWPAQEVWSFEAANAVRVVTVEGASAIDPGQTNLPEEWRALPAYLITPDTALKFITRQRGASPVPDQLSLNRSLWLDFDGAVTPCKIAWKGACPPPTDWKPVPNCSSAGWRSMARTSSSPTAPATPRMRGITPGPVATERRRPLAAPRPRRSTGGRLAIAARSGAYQPQPAARLALAGSRWGHGVSTAWLYQWTLLDLFIVLITTVAFARLWNWWWGLLALAGLTLAYHEPDAPRLLWLKLLAAIALLRVLPPGRLQTLVTWYRKLAVAGLVLMTLAFAIQQAGGLYPQLSSPPTYVDAAACRPRIFRPWRRLPPDPRC